MTRILWALPLAVFPLFAQTYTGSIGGRVTDATGLAIPRTRVTVTEEATNTAAKTETNDSGDYIVSFLKPSSYRVNFSAHGFKEHVESGVLLQLNQSLRVDVVMQVGAVSDRVEVSAAAQQINYVSPEIGHVVGTEQLVNVPLVATNSRGRSPLLLAKLIPGVTSTSFGNINGFSFAGGRPVTNEILVDGLPTTNPSDQTYTLTPSPDSIQEFKVLTTPFSAEYGHTGGGVMMLTSKSGTNEYHGSAYDYFRNRLLNGRAFFQPAKSTQKYVQNDPGGTFGGPVRLPHYNGKDKTFFFSDFNVTLASTGNLYERRVPTAAEKSGDFSQTTSGGGVVTIYDPSTTQRTPEGSYTRALFEGNRIPAARFDAVGREMVKFYPDPNGAYSGANNYSVHPPQIRQTWQWIERVDHNFSSNDKMFVRAGGYHPHSDTQPRILNKANNDTAGGWYDTQIALSETHVFGPRVVNDFRLGFVQEHNYTYAGGSAAPELGLKGSVVADSFPIVNVDQMIQLGSGASDGDRDRSWVFSDALNFQNGRHTLKMGGDYRRQMYNFYNPGKLSGSYSFGPTFTSLPGQNNSGFGLADLLLGLPSSTSIKIQDYTYRLNINSAGIYLQDDFKVMPRLTINLGLRWEYDGPYSEANGQFASFNPNLRNRTTGNLGEVEFARRNGAPDHFSPNIYHNFLPRIGFAWNFAPKTVFRGGYGIYRLPSIGFSGYGPISQYAVDATFSSLDNNVTPAYQLASGVPPYSYNVDANGLPKVPASLTNPTAGVTALERRARTPYNQNWQVGFQRQIGNSWFAEVDYAASKGAKLPVVLNLNQVRPELWSTTVTIAQRPFPQYASAIALYNDGNSIYHSLQAKLEHRWMNGLLVSMAYTFSKFIDDLDAPARSNRAPVQNVYNLKAERGIGGYDTPHRFVANYVWSVPVGRGGKYLNELPVAKEIIGGWQVAGITEFQVGLPIQVTQRQNNLGGFTDTQRPDQIAPAGLPRGDRTIYKWFNTSAFVASAPLKAGTAPRFPLHGTGINNWDIALQRNFRIQERLTMQFRGEFYSAFNHPNFNNPTTQVGNPAYGTISGAGGNRIIEFALRFFF
jgi:hypothetical protein